MVIQTLEVFVGGEIQPVINTPVLVNSKVIKVNEVLRLRQPTGVTSKWPVEQPMKKLKLASA